MPRSRYEGQSSLLDSPEESGELSEREYEESHDPLSLEERNEIVRKAGNDTALYLRLVHERKLEIRRQEKKNKQP